MDTFAGSLDLFPLEQVVGLIAGSGKRGVLKVDNPRLTGRIFVADGGITFATTRDHETRANAASAESDRRARRLREDPTLADADAIEQQIVEVFVRLMRDRQGDFSFVPGVGSPFSGDGGAETVHAVDHVFAQAERHIEQWRRIETLVPDATTPFQVAPQLPADKFEVTLDARKWLFLAAIGDGSSVDDVADRLGIFEYPAAMQVAELVREGLLVPVEDAVPAAEPQMLVRTSFRPAPAGTAPGGEDVGPLPGEAEEPSGGTGGTGSIGPQVEPPDAP